MITLHRPSNVDKEAGLKQIINEILLYSKGYNIIFPMHPRTRKSFRKLKIDNTNIIEAVINITENNVIKETTLTKLKICLEKKYLIAIHKLIKLL